MDNSKRALPFLFSARSLVVFAALQLETRQSKRKFSRSNVTHSSCFSINPTWPCCDHGTRCSPAHSSICLVVSCVRIHFRVRFATWPPFVPLTVLPGVACACATNLLLLFISPSTSLFSHHVDPSLCPIHCELHPTTLTHPSIMFPVCLVSGMLQALWPKSVRCCTRPWTVRMPTWRTCWSTQQVH